MRVECLHERGVSMADLKSWRLQNDAERTRTVDYVAKILGALLLVLAWFAIGALLILPFLAMACFAFGFREQIASIGTKRERKEREEYARLKKKYG